MDAQKQDLWESMILQQSVILRVLVVLVILLGLSEIASAKEQKNTEGDRRASIEVKVPASLRKYKARINGARYKLSDPSISVTPVGKSRRMFVELLDGNNRTVSQNFRLYDEDALSGLKFRQFGIYGVGALGHMNLPEQSSLYLQGDTSSSTYGIEWQPGLLGLKLLRADTKSENCIGQSPCGSLTMKAPTLALNVDAAPFTGGSAFLQRLHLGLSLGVSKVSARYTLVEKDIKVESHSTSIGKYAAFEFRIPITVGLWIDIQHSFQSVPMELKEFGYKETLELTTSGLGVRYEF